MIFKGLFVGLVSLLSVVGCSHVPTYEELTYPAALEAKLESVVSVYPAGGGYCSGWVLKGTHEVVTAAHCAENTEEVLDVDFGDGTKHPFHVKYMGSRMMTTGPDLMVLYGGSEAQGTIDWPIGFEICPFNAYYGEQVLLMGGPLGRPKTISFGRIGNPSTDVGNLINKEVTRDIPRFAKLIEYNGQMFPGNSGGPAVDVYHNCVIGTSELVQLADGGGFGSTPFGINYLTPTSSLHEFL